MKVRSIALAVSALLLASCATTTAPDGSVSSAPDVPLIIAMSDLLQALFPPAATVVPSK